MKRTIIPSETRFIRQAVDELVQFVRGEVPDIDKEMLSVVLSEALTNAVIHGNREDARKMVVAQAAIDSGKIILTVTDEGPGFDYRNLADPLKNENRLKEHGRGLFIIRTLMDEVRFNDAGNEITMIKNVKTPARTQKPTPPHHLDIIMRQAEQLCQIHQSELRFGDMLGICTQNAVYAIGVLEDGWYLASGGWFDEQGLSPKTVSIKGCTWGAAASSNKTSSRGLVYVWNLATGF